MSIDHSASLTHRHRIFEQMEHITTHAHQRLLEGNALQEDHSPSNDILPPVLGRRGGVVAACFDARVFEKSGIYLVGAEGLGVVQLGNRHRRDEEGSEHEEHSLHRGPHRRVPEAEVRGFLGFVAGQVGGEGRWVYPRLAWIRQRCVCGKGQRVKASRWGSPRIQQKKKPLFSSNRLSIPWIRYYYILEERASYVFKHQASQQEGPALSWRNQTSYHNDFVTLGRAGRRK